MASERRAHNGGAITDARELEIQILRPFEGLSLKEMKTRVDRFTNVAGLDRWNDIFLKGALLAQSETAFRNRDDDLKLTDEETLAIEQEFSPRRLDRFRQPLKLYLLVAVCSLGAAVQGWDQTAVNGAQIYYENALAIRGGGLLGLVNGAPYLCCALACCLNHPLNQWFNRRGVIFVTCLISSLTCLLQAFTQSWWQLFLARFALGFGIGPKSATIPIYAAEAAPENIRGALVMMWQMWTAFGIMCGYIFGVVLAGVGKRLDPGLCVNANHVINVYKNDSIPLGTIDVPTQSLNLAGYVSYDDIVQRKTAGDLLLKENAQSALLSSPCSLNWRMMLASPMVLPLFVVAYVYTLPESPRVLLRKARRTDDHKQYKKVFLALCSLRNTEVQAARDMFLMDHLLAEEQRQTKENKRFWQLFSVPRCRNALLASVITMFLQQFCGVNVTAYYSSKILKDDAKWEDRTALLLSMGFGIINFLFALPAVWTIDTFGRRNLLLFTFPFMALFQYFMVVAFALPTGSSARQVLAIVGMYLFGIAYSPGEGPVPFVYSAESMPLYNRDYGMGIVTSINWAFNFFVSMTWPVISAPGAMKTSGAFAFYGTWCIIGWFMVLLFVRETKDLTLEQLDEVFKRPIREHMEFGMNQLYWFVGYHVRRKRHLRNRQPVFLHRERQEERYDRRGNIPLLNRATNGTTNGTMQRTLRYREV